MDNNQLKRKYRVCVKFNHKEFKLINSFCKKYNIKNRSKFIREAVIKSIIEKMVEQDYPKLFPDNEQQPSENKNNKQEINPPKLFNTN